MSVTPASRPGGPSARLVAPTVVALVCLLALVSAAPAAAADLLPAGGRVVVVGSTGLAWSDLADADVPAIDALTASGGVASLTVRAVRSRSCAVDAWLTLSAGRRAGDLPGPCREALDPGADGVVPRWSDYLDQAGSSSFGAGPGLLGQRVADTGGCVETVGPGAAIGGAEGEDGVAPHHHARLPAGFTCPVVLVDAGVLPTEPAARAAAVRTLDGQVARVRALDADAVVVLAGMGDGDSPVRPRALVAAGPGVEPGVLVTTSTRQPGTVQLQDLTATLLNGVGAPTDAVTGRPVEVEEGAADADERVGGVVGAETRSATMRAVSPQVTAWLAGLFAAWCAAVCVSWWRSREVPPALAAVGVGLAAVPVSTFVVNLLPWWDSGAPGVVFVGLLSLAVAVTTVGALAAGRRMPVGELRAIALLTLVVLGGDVLTGSGLQLGSVFGQNPVVGGRFYGLGNTSFALYALAVLVVMHWVGVAVGARSTPRRGAAVASVVLVLALALEASPSLGADFGGPPGLLLGGLVVVASLAQVRITPGRVALAALTAAGLVLVVAVADWLRPPSTRTHLGDFVATALAGGAGDVVTRKISQNLDNLGSPALLALTLGTVAVAVTAWRTGRRPSPAAAVLLRAASVTAAVGFAVNDSGLVIPAYVAVVLVPLLVADAGSTSSTRMPPASLGWMKLTRESLVPRRGAS